MIVLDASAAIEMILGTSSGRLVAALITPVDMSIHAPHLVDLEVAQVLRRYVLRGQLDEDRALHALSDFAELDIARYPHEPFLPRIWELKGRMTAYDAAYVALAEVLHAPLVTRDERLASTRGHRARIHLVR